GDCFWGYHFSFWLSLQLDVRIRSDQKIAERLLRERGIHQKREFNPRPDLQSDRARLRSTFGKHRLWPSREAVGLGDGLSFCVQSGTRSTKQPIHLVDC